MPSQGPRGSGRGWQGGSSESLLPLSHHVVCVGLSSLCSRARALSCRRRLICDLECRRGEEGWGGCEERGERGERGREGGKPLRSLASLSLSQNRKRPQRPQARARARTQQGKRGVSLAPLHNGCRAPPASKEKRGRPGGVWVPVGRARARAVRLTPCLPGAGLIDAAFELVSEECRRCVDVRVAGGGRPLLCVLAPSAARNRCQRRDEAPFCLGVVFARPLLSAPLLVTRDPCCIMRVVASHQ
jgi:hypothetical protein